jgi:hypothetical protein
MRPHFLRLATATASFVSIAAATASGQAVLRTHDGHFNSDGTETGFGYAAGFLGDVDGDGVGDYAVGAFDAAPGGETYVWSGRTGALLYTLFAERAADEFGADLGPVGDLDGDGHADFFVVAPQAPQDQYLTNDGRVYLVSGATGTVLRYFDGTNFEGIRYACGMGDVDGDGVPDVAAYSFVYGHAHGYSGATGALLWTVHQAVNEVFSGPLAGVGDVNGDGVPDLCLAGSGFLVQPWVGVYSGVDGTEIYRTAKGASAVTTVPDVDGDGVREIVAGSQGDSKHAGSVDVYSGASGTLLYTVNDTVPGAYFGIHVADAGDIDGDGVHEIGVVSNPYMKRTNFLGQFFRSDTGALVAAIPSDLHMGEKLAGGYDLDGDGRSEVLITDRSDTDGSTWKGRAFVYRGDDLYLFANQAWFASGDPLVLDSRPGLPGQLASIWILDVDGSPFVLRIAGGAYDGAGSFSLSATVPPGLAGVDLDLLAFGIDGSGHLRRSAVTNVEFR